MTNTFDTETVLERKKASKFQTFSGDRVWYVNTQSEYEKLFGISNSDSNAIFWNKTEGAIVIPENTTIFLNPISGPLAPDLITAGSGAQGGKGILNSNTFNGRPAYILKSTVNVSSNVKIFGANMDDVVVIASKTEHPNAYFKTIPSASTTTDTGSTSNVINLIDATGFEVGDSIHVRDVGDSRQTRKIIAKSGNTVTVDFDFNIAVASGKAVKKCTVGVEFSGWSIDGRGNVNNLGGSNPYSIDQAILAIYMAHCKFNLRMVNYKTGSISAIAGGGAIEGWQWDGISSDQKSAVHVFTSYIEAMNIEDCNIVGGNGGSGGAGRGFNYSKMSATRCHISLTGNTVGRGGAFYNMAFCDLKAIECYVFTSGAGGAYGGAFTECNWSTLWAYRCHVEASGAGPEESQGGVAHSCQYSNIYGEWSWAGEGGCAHSCYGSNITAKKCNANSDLGAGGGAHSCNVCDMMLIECWAGHSQAGQGGGAYDCNFGKAVAIRCWATYEGGGFFFCDNMILEATNCYVTGGLGGMPSYNGGGANSCDRCNIRVEYCYVNSINQSANGGGVSDCDESVISALYCHTFCSGTGTGANGGGANNCDHSTITCQHCYADDSVGTNSNGGGANGCLYSFFIGCWDGCYTSSGTKNFVSASTGPFYWTGFFQYFNGSIYTTVTQTTPTATDI